MLTPVTVNPPPTILTPVLAVTRPTESMLVTSSYVRVPATETFPVNSPSPTTKSALPVFADVVPIPTLLTVWIPTESMPQVPAAPTPPIGVPSIL